MPKVTEIAKIISHEEISKGIISIWLETEAAKYATPGQFINVYSNNASKLLPRPISICEIDNSGKLRIVFRVVGEGTYEFSTYKVGDTLRITGPLGNGFYGAIQMAQSEAESSKDKSIYTTKQLLIGSDTKALLIGGGIGIPPMLGLADSLQCDKTLVCGYRSDKELFLVDEIEKVAKLYIATDDGSLGTNGTVIDAIEENKIEADVIFACGPKPMLRGVKALGMKLNIPTYVSMEERMACGVGACLGCVCKTTEIDSHSNVKNKRVCVDGPVFLSTEVEL